MPAHCVSHNALLQQLNSDPASWSREARVTMLSQVEGLRGWLDAREAAVLAVAFSECDDVNSGARDLIQLLQQQAGVSYGVAKRREQRALWLPELPVAAAALTAGQIGTGQVDELCALAERLPPALRPELRATEATLVTELTELTPVQARKRLLAWESDITPAQDSETKLRTQRAANRLRFAKNSDGTTSLFGQLDPVSAAYLRTAVDRKVTELWRREPGAITVAEPPDDVITSERRRAEALIELVREAQNGGPGGRGHADILVHIDYKTLIGDLAAAGICHLADGTPIPPSEARRLACEANIIPVVLNGPSQPLDVGRGSRTATPAQRTASRTVHNTCCIKGCDVVFEHCQLHHIKWWRHGGPTNLNNLVPVCSKHHHLIHDHKWKLQLDQHRVGTLHPARQGSDPALSFAHPPSSQSKTRAVRPQEHRTPMLC